MCNGKFPTFWKIMTDRTRTTISIVSILLLVAAGLIIYYLRTPADTPEPPAPSEPSQSAESEEPSEPAEPEEPSEPEEPQADWSEPIMPVCGEELTAADLNSSLEFLAPPQTLSPSDSFPVAVHNYAHGPVLTAVDRYDVAVPVLTDDTGTVVAMAPLEPVLAEGYSVLAVAADDELDMSGTLQWAIMCGDDPDELDPDPLPEGDYNLFLLASTVPEDPAIKPEQIQGGPFPITIDAGATHEVPEAVVTGGHDIPVCGQEWNGTAPGAPGELTNLTDDVASDGEIALSGEFSLPEKVSGANVYAQIFILDQGRIVGPLPHASDNLLGWYASAGLGEQVAAVSPAVTCDGEALTPGDYEAVLVVSTISENDSTLAVGDLASITVP